MTLYDRLYGLELDLAKYPPDQPGSAINRRLLLRKALTEHGTENWQQGYTEGMRDQRDSDRAERELAGKKDDDNG